MDDFFELDDKKYFKNVLLIDYYNLVYRCLFSSMAILKKEKKKENLDEGFGNWKFLMLNQIKDQIHLHKPERVIVAIDSRNYWRKSIYPQYKGNRKSARTRSGIDFDAFFPMMEAFTDELKKVLPNLVYIKVDGAEADDVIAVLTKEVLKNVPYITCLSTDTDLHQLLKYKNYNQYDPIRKHNVSVFSPTKNLLIKILKGDKGDNISGIKDRMGIKTAKKIIDEGLEEYFQKNQKTPQLKENFKRNKILIDLDMIPGDISTTTKKVYSEYVTGKFDGRKLFSFLIKNNQPRLVEEAQSFIDDLKRIS